MNGVAKMPKLGMQSIRRRQLIDATLEAINEVGMHDATIAQIARRAGVSTGIISHYFRDKNGLLEATMRDITSQLRDAVLNRLHALPQGSAEQRLQAIVGGNFDETQVSSAAMKAWLAFWASSMHQPMLYRLQQVSSRRLLSNLVSEFRRELPREQAQEAKTEADGMPQQEETVREELLESKKTAEKYDDVERIISEAEEAAFLEESVKASKENKKEKV